MTFCTIYLKCYHSERVRASKIQLIFKITIVDKYCLFQQFIWIYLFLSKKYKQY